MATVKINKTAVDRLAMGETLWDTEVKGFGCRRQKGEARTYVLKYRAGKRQRFQIIGRHGSPWTAEEARREAKRLLGAVASGTDPAGLKAEDRKALTVAQVIDLWEVEAAPRLKPKSVACYLSAFRHHIRPQLGQMLAKDVKAADVSRLVAAIAAGRTATAKTSPEAPGLPVRGGKTVADRARAYLAALMTFAVRQGIRADNPAKGVPGFKPVKRDRYLSNDELRRLGEALAAAEAEGVSPFGIACIRLLLLTGARRNEIAALRWEWIDFERGAIRLPDSKTGAKAIPVSAPALALLASLPRHAGSPFVFPASRGAGPYDGLGKVWMTIRARAGLDGRMGRDPTAKPENGVRLHDLRHSFASVAVAGGDSLYLVGKVLGHAQASMTERYAHVTNDPVRAVADRAAGKIAAELAAGAGRVPTAEIVPLRPKRRGAGSRAG